MNQEAKGETLDLPMGTERRAPSFRKAGPFWNRVFGKKTVLIAASCLVAIVCESTEMCKTAQAYSKSTQTPLKVTVTAYTNLPAFTDSSPNETASSLRIQPRHYWKIIALSADLAKRYKFGDRFELRVDGQVYLVEFQDLMPRRHKNRIDFLLPSTRKCRKFGVNRGVLIPLGESDRRSLTGPG